MGDLAYFGFWHEKGNVFYTTLSNARPNHLNELIQDLKNRSSEFIRKATFHHLARANEAANGRVVATMGIPTIISLTRGEAAPESFEKSLESLVKYRK